MGKLYVIMGKSATGKDTVYRLLMERHPELKRVVPYTTRPIREGEENGKEYFFVTEEEMRQMEQNRKIVESRCYNTVHGPWYYFTAEDGQIDLKKENSCLISTVEGYCKIRDYYGENSVEPLYIEVDDCTRLMRALNREKEQKSPCVAEVCRRFLADEEDFSKEKLAAAGIEFSIENNSLEKTLEKIENILVNIADTL